MRSSPIRWAAIAAVVALLPTAAHADDMVELVDKTRLVGQIVHYYEGVLSVRLANGQTMQLPREKVRQIVLQLPKPRAELSTPRKAFERLRRAALKGDVETYIDAHSAYYQMFLGHQANQVGMGKFRSQLKKEWGEVKLEIVGEETKGGVATLKIRRKGGDDTQDGELRFVKENGEWKMILPL